MKKLLYLVALLLCGCAMEPNEGLENNEQDVTVYFTVDVPEATPAISRAVINENQIDNLYILVFDENGRFMKRVQASLAGNHFTATLPQSSNKRTVHFIANYDWTTFNDAIAMTKDEGEIVAPLQSGNLIFWQRLVLNSGIYTNVFTDQPVSLIRNMAKFTLENSAAQLTNVKFALYNKASVGSVAPFNTVTRDFELVVTEPRNVTYTGQDAMTTDPIYAFERKNSMVVTNPTFVIIEGTYAGATNYYKIDIIDESKNMYDITRNVWFRILVQEVGMAGYSTVTEAINAPASNNIAASVLVQSYPTISDGSFVMSVNKTAFSFTTNGEVLHAIATYKTVAGVSRNDLATVTLIQDVNFPLVNGAVNYDIATGAITANIHNVPTDGAARMATIKIAAGNLSRTIRLMLHAPFNFASVSLTPSTVGSALDSPATLKFTIPVEAQYLLPFYCTITSAYLYPNFGNIEVIYEDGLYKYKWKVYNTGEQMIGFKTNTANAAETIFIEADLFKRAEINYGNSSGGYRFSNVVLTPNRVDFGINQPVTLRFTVPTTGTFSIYTNNLTPVSGSVSGGIYNYTATTTGEQVVAFTTNNQNCAEIIKITGVNYTPISVPLKNVLIQLSGTLRYGAGAGTLIPSGIVNILINGLTVNIFQTNASGVYTAGFDAKIGDLITLTYKVGNTTYSATTTVTSATMTYTTKLV